MAANRNSLFNSLELLSNLASDLKPQAETTKRKRGRTRKTEIQPTITKPRHTNIFHPIASIPTELSYKNKVGMRDLLFLVYNSHTQQSLLSIPQMLAQKELLTKFILDIKLATDEKDAENFIGKISKSTNAFTIDDAYTVVTHIQTQRVNQNPNYAILLQDQYANSIMSSIVHDISKVRKQPTQTTSRAIQL